MWADACSRAHVCVCACVRAHACTRSCVCVFELMRARASKSPHLRASPPPTQPPPSTRTNTHRWVAARDIEVGEEFLQEKPVAHAIQVTTPYLPLTNPDPDGNRNPPPHPHLHPQPLPPPRICTRRCSATSATARWVRTQTSHATSVAGLCCAPRPHALNLTMKPRPDFSPNSTVLSNEV